MKIRKEKKSLIAALLLFVCVAASTMIVVEQMSPYLLSDKGAIPFIDNVEAAESMMNNQIQIDAQEVPNEKEPDASKPEAQDTHSQQPTQTPSTNSTIVPEMETGDDVVVWEKESEVEIFRVSYENESGEITVLSSNGDKVIAPGTENSYTFRLKNTGNYAIDYKVEMESFVTTSNYDIPIESRISCYDGKWLIGNSEEYVDLEAFHAVDTGTVGPGKFIYYTLDWVWPFEGNDELDTMLGNLSVDEDLSFTIILRTEATLNGDPNADGGFKAPQMGDGNRMVIWITLIAVSLVAIIFLLIFRDKDEEEEQELPMEEKDFESDKKIE